MWIIVAVSGMAKEEDDDLPDKDAAKEFYAKYEPKEIIGRCVFFCNDHLIIILTSISP